MSSSKRLKSKPSSAPLMYVVCWLRTHIDARNTIFFSVAGYKPHGTTDYTDGV